MLFVAILWMDEILHHLRDPGMILPLQIPANNGFNHGIKVAQNGFCPSTVGHPSGCTLVGIGIFTGGTIWLLSHGHMFRDPLPKAPSFPRLPCCGQLQPPHIPTEKGLARAHCGLSHPEATDVFLTAIGLDL